MIVDAHVHIFPERVRTNMAAIAARDPWFGHCHPEGARTASAQSLIQAMDAAGVDRAVCFTWPFRDPGLCAEANDYMGEVVRDFGDRLIGFGIVQPAEPGAPAEVERCARLGLRGIGELNADAQGFDIDSDETDDAIAATVMCDMVWNIHCSEPVGHDYPGKGTFTPDRLEELLSDNPDLTVIGAHLGGGIGFYAHMPEMRLLLKNLYVDTAAQPFLYDAGVYRELIAQHGVDRVLFGSDHPLLELPRYRAALEAAGIDSTAQEAILGGNAKRLFGLS